MNRLVDSPRQKRPINFTIFAHFFKSVLNRIAFDEFVKRLRNCSEIKAIICRELLQTI